MSGRPAGAAVVDRVAAELGLVEPDVMVLPGGSANRTLRLRDAARDLVLRLPSPGAGALGASRTAECAMHSLAAGAGLAPPVVLARPAQGILVVEYVEGRTPSREELREPGCLQRVGAWFARLHALPPPPGLAPIDFADRAAACLQRLRAVEPAARIDRLERRLAERRQSLPAVDMAPCHHDLHHRNLVESGGSLQAIDWEYAGPGDPAADLAACIRYHDLGPAGRGALVDGYGDGAAAVAERLDCQCWIFDCLWYGWLGVAALGGLGADASLRARLLVRLGS